MEPSGTSLSKSIDSTPSEISPPREELISLFYNSMLDMVVKSWTIGSLPETGSVVFLDEEPVLSKDFRSLTEADLKGSQILDVVGSNVSLAQKSGSKVETGKSNKEKVLKKKRKSSDKNIPTIPEGLDEMVNFKSKLWMNNY